MLRKRFDKFGGNLFDYARRLCSDELPIVSVGSGDGYFESKLIEQKICIPICIDPNPSWWGDGSDLERSDPKYSIVEDLIQDNPAIIRNCSIILSWPLNDNYDIRAINDLDPKRILLIYDDGITGSDTFHYWLNQMDLPSMLDYHQWLPSRIEDARKLVPKTDYRSINTIYHLKNRKWVLSVLTRND